MLTSSLLVVQGTLRNGKKREKAGWHSNTEQHYNSSSLDPNAQSSGRTEAEKQFTLT